MAALTTLQKITISKISEYLSAVAIQKGAKDIDVQLPGKLYNIRKTIEYIYAQSPSNAYLTQTSNYLYGLCAFSLQAQGIVATAGIIAGIIARAAPLPYQFFITSNSTPMANGDSSVTLTSYIGYNLLFNRGYVPQGNVDPGNSMSYYSWDKVSGIFTAFPAAISTEFFQLFPI